MNCECWQFSKSQTPYRNTQLSISVGLQKYKSISLGLQKYKIEYFCRGQRHWSTSYYTSFRCQTRRWNQGPNMGNEVRGREKKLQDLETTRRSYATRRLKRHCKICSIQSVNYTILLIQHALGLKKADSKLAEPYTDRNFNSCTI